MTESADFVAVGAPGDRQRVRVAVRAGVATVALAAFVVFMAGLAESASLWVGVPAIVLLLTGVLSGERGPVAGAAVAIAGAGLIASHGQGTASALLFNAAIGALVVALLAISDLSFVSRRAEVVSGATVRGSAQAVAVAVGLGTAVTVPTIMVASASRWPGWMLVVVAAALAAGCFVLAVGITRGQSAWLKSMRR
ncbi:MAG: hypothetical protein AAF567_21850 [Actinomycetota bacterium]